MKFFYFYLLVLTCLFSGCYQRTEDISIIALIADPHKYEDKKIRVIGYLHLEFEGNVLYFHKDDYNNAISKNALWVDIKRSPKDSLKKYSDHYVIMEGLFDGYMQGHMGMNSGSIKKITRLDLWEPNTGRTVKEHR